MTAATLATATRTAAAPYGTCAAAATGSWLTRYPTGRPFTTHFACPSHASAARDAAEATGLDWEPGPDLIDGPTGTGLRCGTVLWTARERYSVYAHPCDTADLPKCLGCAMPLPASADSSDWCGPACQRDCIESEAERLAAAWPTTSGPEGTPS